jgi:predicted amidohydrolase
LPGFVGLTLPTLANSGCHGDSFSPRLRMRLLLCAITCAKGDVDGNLGRHLDLLAHGRREACDLVLLPEMSLTGYRAGAAVSLRHPAVAAFVSATASGPAVCFGLAESAEGKPYIAHVVAADGAIVAVHRKAHLGEGEAADFRPGEPAPTFRVADMTCSLAVCAEIGSAPPYALGSQLVLGPAAPGLYGDRRRTDDDWKRGFDWWRGSVVGDAKRLLGFDQWLAVSTQAGATDDEDFPGWAALAGPGGDVVAELPDGREGTLVVDVATTVA